MTIQLSSRHHRHDIGNILSKILLIILVSDFNLHIVIGTRMNEPDHGIRVDLAGSVRSLELELVQDSSEEEEELVESQCLSDAESLAQHEWDASLVASECA